MTCCDEQFLDGYRCGIGFTIRAVEWTSRNFTPGPGVDPALAFASRIVAGTLAGVADSLRMHSASVVLDEARRNLQ